MLIDKVDEVDGRAECKYAVYRELPKQPHEIVEAGRFSVRIMSTRAMSMATNNGNGCIE